MGDHRRSHPRVVRLPTQLLNVLGYRFHSKNPRCPLICIFDTKTILGRLIYLWLVESSVDRLTIEVFDLIGHNVAILYVDDLVNLLAQLGVYPSVNVVFILDIRT